MTILLLCIDRAIFIFFFTVFFQILVSIIALIQCSHKKPEVGDKKDKVEEKAKNVDKPIPKEVKQVRSDNVIEKNKQVSEERRQTSAAEDAEKEKERLREEGEKHIEEIKPKVMKRNAKEERIAKGKETRGKSDYPTMDDVLSDWDSEKEGKKKNDDENRSKVNTNLEDADDMRKNEEKKTADDEKKESKH